MTSSKEIKDVLVSVLPAVQAEELQSVSESGTVKEVEVDVFASSAETSDANWVENHNNASNSEPETNYYEEERAFKNVGSAHPYSDLVTFDDIGEVSKDTDSPRIIIEDSFKFLDSPKVVVENHLVKYFASFTADDEALEQVNLFIRWGSYDEPSEEWADSEVKPLEISKDAEGIYHFCKTVRIERRGWYGATAYAVAVDGDTIIWQGSGYGDDARFRIASDSKSLIEKIAVSRYHATKDAERTIIKRLGSYPEFEKAVYDLHNSRCKKDLPRMLFDCSRGSVGFRDLVTEYRREAGSREVDESTTEKAGILSDVLDNVGIGEVVMVAPEGPHAIAGGLAQVMSGLLTTLSKNKIPVTLISPLYEFKQGNRHRSADELLREGIRIGSKTLMLQRAGEVDIALGPLCGTNGGGWLEEPHSIESTVYIAEDDYLRIVLLRHKRYADQIYPHLMPDEALRRAIFLSRGALEVMKNPLFGIHPHIIMSNDWVSALVPVFLERDDRYRLHESFRNHKTVHMIHNCGRDYHGRIPVNHDGQSLWPLLEIHSDFFGSLADPNEPGVMNLTSAAISHLNGALLAVSRSYAEQLLSWGGGEGLNELLWSKRQSVYGISNAIDQTHFRKTIVRIGEVALSKLDPTHIVNTGRVSETDGCSDTFLSRLPRYKSAVKKVLQRREGLKEDDNAIVLSMVGRLAEQKGLDLLHGWPEGEGISVMESILIRYPEAQFVIAGPTVKGDVASERFRALVEHLAAKYPGRVAPLLDFIAPDYAIEIFLGSDFSLMPSRFEPGGLTQLESLTCGTMVVARNVGGLSATLKQMDLESAKGNGFLFDDYSPTALRNTICWAIDSTRDKEFKRSLVLQSALSEHDWSHRVLKYIALFQHLAGALNPEGGYDFLREKVELLNQIRPAGI